MILNWTTEKPPNRWTTAKFAGIRNDLIATITLEGPHYCLLCFARPRDGSYESYIEHAGCHMTLQKAQLAAHWWAEQNGAGDDGHNGTMLHWTLYKTGWAAHVNDAMYEVAPYRNAWRLRKLCNGCTVSIPRNRFGSGGEYVLMDWPDLLMVFAEQDYLRTQPFQQKLTPPGEDGAAAEVPTN